MKEGEKTPHSHSRKHDSAGGHIFAVHKRPWTAETGRTATRSQAELTVTELPSPLLGARLTPPSPPASLTGALGSGSSGWPVRTLPL